MHPYPPNLWPVYPQPSPDSPLSPLTPTDPQPFYDPLLWYPPQKVPSPAPAPPQPPPPLPTTTYPNLGTTDMHAFDEHGPHIPLRRHALYPPRNDAPYRRPSIPLPEHHLTETHSIPAATLDSFFNTVTVAGNSGRRAWVCQQCTKPVRKQDRAAHMLSHQGKKRYDCRCGKRFGRPQDADRHIREQAPCQTCEGKMGRYGKDGRCSTCVLESEHGHS